MEKINFLRRKISISLLLFIAFLAVTPSVLRYVSFFPEGSFAQVGGAPNVSISPSRTSGVAPLAVHFDASGTTDSSTSRPFHDLQYSWDFGDPSAGTWSTTGNSKNSAFSPETGHLYANPGTYTARLTVINANGNSSSQTVTITVQDPNTVYAEANTYCYANASLETADWSGCPSEATREGGITSVSSALTSTRVQQNTRHLFKRGDTFTVGTYSSVVTGPVTISAFGSGAKPVFQGSVAAQQSTGIFQYPSDWRITDIRITSSGGGTALVSRDSRSTSDANNTVAYNVDIDNVFSCFSTWDSNSIDTPGRFASAPAFIDINCTSGPAPTMDGYAIGFQQVSKIMLLGFNFDGSASGARPWRSTHLDRAVFQNNRFTTSGWLQFTIRACGSNTYTARCPAGTLVPDEYNVFSDNHFRIRGSNSNLFIFCNNDECDLYGTAGNPTRNHIIERNFFTAVGTVSGMQRFFDVRGGNITVRNNIFDLTGIADAGFTMPLVNVQTVAPTENGATPNFDNHHVYHNSILWNSGAGDLGMCSFSAGTGHRCQNNLLYTPGGTPSFGSGGGIISTGNIIATSYPFSGSYPGQGNTTASSFQLSSGSSAINAGTAISSARITDYFGTTARTGAWDVGAIESGGGGTPPPPPPSDTTAPTVPTGLSATAVSSSQINLSWNASTDAVGVTGYRIYRNGTQITTVTGTTYQNTGLTPATSYSYTVAAYDAVPNVSSQSSSVNATTQSGTTPASCGNNVREGTEVCDGTALNGQSCTTQGFTGGTLSCNASCTGYNTSLCTAPPPGGTITSLVLMPQVEGGSAAGKSFTIQVLNNTSGAQIQSLTRTADPSGRITLTSPTFSSGTYRIRFTTSGFLRRVVPNLSMTNNGTVTLAALMAGDLNSDAVINSLDWSVMNAQWGTNNIQSDINRDGIVNSIDFSFLNKNWMLAGE